MWLLLAGVSSRASAGEDSPSAPDPTPPPAVTAPAPAASPEAAPTTDPAPAAEAAPEPAAEVAPAPAAAAAAPDPAAPAPDPAAPATDPAAPAPDPAAPATPPRFRIVDAPDAPGGWQVVDAAGGPLDSATLAAALEDVEALGRLRRDRVQARLQDLALVGIGLGAASGGVLLLTVAGPAETVGARPDPLVYAEWSDWRADTDAWEARMDQADVRDERMWGGATLLTGAVLAGALVPLTGRDALARAEHPALLWERPTLLQRLTPTASVSPTYVQLAWVLP